MCFEKFMDNELRDEKEVAVTIYAWSCSCLQYILPG